MKRGIAMALLVVGAAASAEEGRFDVQSFRPLGAPQDLVMVGQSRPMSHLSAAAGLYLSYALDPLALVDQVTGKKNLTVVGNRLQIDAIGAIGLFDWGEVAVDLPLVLFQSSDNLADVGTEGHVQPAALGDLRLMGKVAIPGLRRKAEGKGFGGALTFALSFPTGVVDAFTSDGTVTYQPGVILDYRFGNAILIALNASVWFRPDREFVGLKLGDMLDLGGAVEVPVVRRWGITVLGELYGNISLTTLPDKPRQVPAEFLLGIRWYSSSGFTLTFVGGGGCDCAFGAPTLRLFASLVWVPKRTREYEALERFKRPPDDPDSDGVIGDKDRCPNQFGPVENAGCPDTDKDKDGIVDRIDKCPDDAAAPGRGDGCPLARVVGNKITIVDQVHFATDQDVILPESFSVLASVAEVMKQHPEIQRVLVEGHCDIRASDEYNMDLSNRRAASVMRFLISQGVDPARLHSQGFGRRRPIAPNDSEAGMAMNRRVEFTIEQGEPEFGPEPPPTPAQPPPHKPGVLPWREQSQGVLPSAKDTGLPSVQQPKSVLPHRSKEKKSVLPSEGVLPNAPPNQH